ncbi:MAG: deoxyribonuclease IV [Candidatus Acidiferrum sp.]
MPADTDILSQPAPTEPPRLTSRRIGIHTSTSGGVSTAAERAYRLGCNTFQIFSSSPRQWMGTPISTEQCEKIRALRETYSLAPLVIHVNYLVNLAGMTAEFHAKSIAAFRGELERGLALGAEFLVLHPGSFRDGTREQGFANVVQGISKAADGLDLESANLTVLIENSAGSEHSLGSTFESVAELIARLRGVAPAAACIDTCHTHVAGYEIVSESGMDETLTKLDATVGLDNVHVWHCNDAKAAFGSKLDRHQHIGEGSIGSEPFRRLLNHPRLAHAAFIAETPIDAPGDDLRNVEALKQLVEEKSAALAGARK